MNFTLTITGEQPSELIAALKGFTQNQAAEVAVKPKRETLIVTAPITATHETPAEDKQPEAEKSTDKITIELVRKAVQEKSKAGKREDIKKILKDFNVENVTSLETAQYADFLKKIEAL